jgi:hypothetical protein
LIAERAPVRLRASHGVNPITWCRSRRPSPG